MKKLFTNSFWIALNRITNYFFLIVTYAYVVRILSVDGIGTYNYIKSIVNYFVLIAGLGVSSYAIREGTKRRNDASEIQGFVSEIFSINFYCSVLAYLALLAIFFGFKDNLARYEILFWICSVLVLLVPFEFEWIYSVYEDFRLLAIRNAIFRLAGLIAIILFVKKRTDVINYALILTAVHFFTVLFNFCITRKRTRFSLCVSFKRLHPHLKHIFLMFFTTIAINLYTSSDITMLGIVAGSYEVALYSNAVQIYSIIDSLVASIAEAAYPAMMAREEDGKNSKSLFAGRVLSVMLAIVLPIATGLCCLSWNAIYIVSGEEYTAASMSLSLLSVALVFNILNWFWTRCVIFPNNLEKKMLVIALVAGVLNVALNIWVLPRFGRNGAAVTTIIAEVLSTCGYYIAGKKYVSGFRIINLLKIAAGCMGIAASIFIIKGIISNFWLRTLMSVLCGILAYALIEGMMFKREIRLHLKGGI